MSADRNQNANDLAVPHCGTAATISEPGFSEVSIYDLISGADYPGCSLRWAVRPLANIGNACTVLAPHIGSLAVKGREGCSARRGTPRSGRSRPPRKETVKNAEFFDVALRDSK